MSKLKNLFVNRWMKFLAALLGVLGFSVFTWNCEWKELYGCPYARYKFNGNVKSQDGKNLEQIQVNVKQYYQTFTTDSEGNYNMDFEATMGNDITIYCTDPKDVYLPDSAKFTVKYQGGDGDWFQGTAEKTVDFVLKKKE